MSAVLSLLELTRICCQYVVEAGSATDVSKDVGVIGPRAVFGASGGFQ
jgi:hypothetical protein